MKEIRATFSRSGGPGGQHVNKVETGVLLSFDVATSPSLTDEQRELIRVRLKGRIDRKGVLQLSENRERGQWRNRERALEKFRELLRNALRKEKVRVKTRTTANARENRLQVKRLHSGKKASRRKPQPDQD